MLSKFGIKNYRCFDELNLENIARLNLIGGMNNVGKTSLLEAIFLYLGANVPDLALRVNMYRGMEQFNHSLDSLWGWLFTNKSINNIIQLTGINEEGIKEIVEIQLTHSDNLKLSSSEDINGSNAQSFSSLTTELIPNELNFIYQKNNQKFISSLTLTSNGLIGKREQITLIQGVFITSTIRSTREDVERFSNLEKVNRQGEIVDTLKLLEPRLQRLAILIQGGFPVIAGDIGIGELIPMAYMGEGICRLLSIILAIATTKNGIVLIDEIENGLHYSKIVEIWKAIDLISHKMNTQIFATTHSMECIESAHKAFNELSEYNFSYYRLERKKDSNKIKVLTYNKNTINTSIDLNLEMR
ncbi:AAA family ATPase [Geminocystis herdmanii]|uniref:AAA family ATPase n=1 Tax=Geminocystis herdmanii TaxID=669359 RepID=UPI00034C5177|nr:AAA family ATPase [Geminocystis herdmanii]